MTDKETHISLAGYKETLTQPLRPMSLCFLIDGNKVLLGWKAWGFGKDKQAGKDKWNGAGGKLQPGETIEQCAIREAREEFGVTPTSLIQTAVINFYFPHVPEEENWNQQVHVFLAEKWQGELKPSDEMVKLQWFEFDQLPFDQMWAADKLWLPQVLARKQLQADIMFAGQGKQIMAHEIKIGEH